MFSSYVFERVVHIRYIFLCLMVGVTNLFFTGAIKSSLGSNKEGEKEVKPVNFPFETLFLSL